MGVVGSLRGNALTRRLSRAKPGNYPRQLHQTR